MPRLLARPLLAPYWAVKEMKGCGSIGASLALNRDTMANQPLN